MCSSVCHYTNYEVRLFEIHNVVVVIAQVKESHHLKLKPVLFTIACSNFNPFVEKLLKITTFALYGLIAQNNNNLCKYQRKINSNKDSINVNGNANALPVILFYIFFIGFFFSSHFHMKSTRASRVVEQWLKAWNEWKAWKFVCRWCQGHNWKCQNGESNHKILTQKLYPKWTQNNSDGDNSFFSWHFESLLGWEFAFYIICTLQDIWWQTLHFILQMKNSSFSLLQLQNGSIRIRRDWIYAPWNFLMIWQFIRSFVVIVYFRETKVSHTLLFPPCEMWNNNTFDV